MTEGKKNLLSKFLVTDMSFYKKAMLIIIPVLLQNMINQLPHHDGYHHGGAAG